MPKINSFYFSHDCNAHKDPKCSALINDFGMEGYGIYWILIEIMHEQGGKIKKFPKLYDGLAFQLKIEKDKLVKQIEALLQDYELFIENENYIWSERVLKNIETREAKRLAKAEAGRLGGIASGEARRSNALSKTKQNEANEAKEREGEGREREGGRGKGRGEEKRKGEERKGKERKGNKEERERKRKKAINKEFLRKLRKDEKFRWLDVDDELERWKDWKSSKGRAFKNNQAAFRNWLRKSLDFLYERQPELKAKDAKDNKKPQNDWHAKFHLKSQKGGNNS